ncbi:MAG: DMT family transporter [Alphaproteobacteria bacterium]
MAPHHFALIVLICLVWGFNFVAGKVGVEQFPPLFFTALRFCIVGVLLAPLLRWYPGRMRQVMLIGIFAGSLHFGLIFVGLTMADVGTAAIVTQLNVPFVTLLSVLVLGEQIGWKRGLGISLAIVGVMVISFDPGVFDQGMGLVLMAGAALCIAVAMIMMRRMRGVSALGMQAWIALLSAPALLAASFLVETDQWAAARTAEPIAWAAVFYTALGASLIGHGGMYYLLQRYEASLTGPMMVMAPIFSIFFGVTVLGEPMTGRILVGGGVTLLGVLIVALREGRKARPVAPAGTAPGVQAPGQQALGRHALGQQAPGPADPASPSAERVP